jgi:beta-galactosidase
MKTWKEVDLPHDFSMERIASEDNADHIGPFSKFAKNGRSSGYTVGGTGYYKKELILSPSDEGKTILIVFDGAYMETEVSVNGRLAQTHKNGYTPFSVDITDFLKEPGISNEIEVKVTNPEKTSRWFSGSGLYRDVKIMVTDPIHVDLWGIHVRPENISSERADIHVDLSLKNDTESDADVEIRVDIMSHEGKLLASSFERETLKQYKKNEFSFNIALPAPQFWSIEKPILYTAIVSLSKEGKEIDRTSTKFGVRTIAVDTQKGFQLNGETVLLKGACLHHDNGLLGAASYKSAEYRKVKLMKNNGFNAIRCAHNPPSEHFLEACDELGMLVINEFSDMWELPKSANDYSRFFKEYWEADLTNMLLRDRNHPCVVMWSIGNEVPNWSIQDSDRISSMLASKVRELDPTRPVTVGVTSAYIHLDWENSEQIFKNVDVAGYNYLRHYVEIDHEKFPERVIMGTESYPNQSYEYWKEVEEKPFLIGDFLWAGIDYLGEVNCGSARYVDPNNLSGQRMPVFQTSMGPEENQNPAMRWQFPDRPSSDLPINYLSWTGDVDILGQTKPQGIYRNVLWDISPIEINVHEPIPDGMTETLNLWGWPRELPQWYWPGAEGKNLQVRVFTKYPEVELQLDRKSLGSRHLVEEDKYIATFEVPYSAGALTAIAKKSGKEVARKTLSTPGEPVAIHLSADKTKLDANERELSYVDIEVVDKDGNIVPDAFPLSVSMSGNGTFVGGGNASANGMKSFGSLTPQTYRGRAQIIVLAGRENGAIQISVKSEGLKGGELTVKVK